MSIVVSIVAEDGNELLCHPWEQSASPESVPQGIGNVYR